MTQHFDQVFIAASNGAGGTEEFHFPNWQPGALLEAGRKAAEYAQSEGGYGYVLLMGRNRLNHFVGPPNWSDPTIIQEL